MNLALLRDLNWAASLRLAARCGSFDAFLCRGKVHLHLASDAKILRSSDGARSQIGIPMFGNRAVRGAVTVISVEQGGTLQLDGAMIGRGAAVLIGPGGGLKMGQGSYLTDGSKIYANRSIEIGKGCAISWGVTLLDDDGHGFGDAPYSAPIRIGDHVWIGCNVTILKGVEIGEGSVIGAGSVVTRSCPPRSLIAGNPAKLIRADVAWKSSGAS